MLTYADVVPIRYLLCTPCPPSSGTLGKTASTAKAACACVAGLRINTVVAGGAYCYNINECSDATDKHNCHEVTYADVC
jgi:hypothetical protein